MYLRCDRTFIEHLSLIVEALATQGINSRVVSPVRIDCKVAAYDFCIHIQPQRFVTYLNVWDALGVPLLERTAEEKAYLRSASNRSAFIDRIIPPGSRLSFQHLLENAEIAEAVLMAAGRLQWEVITDGVQAEIDYVQTHFPTHICARDIIVAIKRVQAEGLQRLELKQSLANLADERDRLLTELYQSIAST